MVISNSASFESQSVENFTSSPMGFIQRLLASFRKTPELPKIRNFDYIVNYLIFDFRNSAISNNITNN